MRNLFGYDTIIFCSRDGTCGHDETFVGKWGINRQTKNYKGVPPLSEAAAQGKIRSVRFLLEAGANPNGNDYSDGFPLRMAASIGHFAVVKLLIQSECLIDLPDKFGRNAMSKTIDSWIYRDNDKNLQKCASLFLSAGSDKRKLTMNDNKKTLLHKTAKVGSFNVIKFFIEFGANLNALDEEGNTPLHIAIKSSNNSVAQILKSAGADSTITNNYGRTVFDEGEFHAESNSKYAG